MPHEVKLVTAEMVVIRSGLAPISSVGVVAMAHDEFRLDDTPLSEASSKQPDRIWPPVANDGVCRFVNVPGGNMNPRSDDMLYDCICESMTP